MDIFWAFCFGAADMKVSLMHPQNIQLHSQDRRSHWKSSGDEPMIAVDETGNALSGLCASSFLRSFFSRGKRRKTNRSFSGDRQKGWKSSGPSRSQTVEISGMLVVQ
jgi:hypothetical protein